MSKYLCTQYAETHRALDAALRRATKAQRRELIGLVEDTHHTILEDRLVSVWKSNGIDKSRCLLWVKFCEDWERLDRKLLTQGEPSKPQDSFEGLLDDPKKIWRELDELEGGVQ